MLPATTQRVLSNSSGEVTREIRRQTEERVAAYARAGRAAINRRLDELAREWDIERTVETLAPSLTLAGLGLGLAVDKRWFVLPIVVQTFFLEHALQGWCPPIPVLRRLGVRTTTEIDEERNALKALRGDYEDVRPAKRGNAARQAMEAAER